MDLLHYKRFGEQGQPLLILHGLFGSLDNWASQARRLGEHFRVVAVDLRNHGQSPHTDAMGYPAMARDIIALLDYLGFDSTQIIGHSMGGKTAMQLALDHPARITRLLVVDIAPRRYPDHHSAIFNALQNLDLKTLESRQAADLQITAAVPETAIRSFLLKNLQRDNGRFRWKINLPVLRNNYAQIAAAVDSTRAFGGDTLFIRGGQSDYIGANDAADIKRLFPAARAKSIQSAGHWPHVEKAAVFNKIAEDFLGDQ